jgi:hypothetical protein
MKKVSLSLALVCCLILSSFTMAPAHRAVSFNEQFTFDVSPLPPIQNPCTGELVDLDGNIHVVVHGVVNKNKISLSLHGNFQQLSGTGATGTRYAGGGASNAHVNESFNGAFNAHLVSSTVLTTSGRDNNIFVKARFHVTVNANGDVTAEMLDVTAECK